MKSIVINNIEYKFRCVYAVSKGINRNTGIHLQIEVFKDNIQLDKQDLKGYIGEKIEDYVKELLQ